MHFLPLTSENGRRKSSITNRKQGAIKRQLSAQMHRREKVLTRCKKFLHLTNTTVVIKGCCTDINSMSHRTLAE
ncbi:hypothetical protein EUGRSUZ_H03033 [Eucalyptus grandis]|uniref:Uncharacterized protein n=2 Tax=Eucalyptus grandis TaxID=71139 RepID=A0A059B345_EUCGR|nr:hypothetical protein EUGRSUZ_H03033 [Eucalyptus grandis]